MPNTRWTAQGTIRRCTRCSVEFNETTENFSYNRSRDRFNSWCRPCCRAHSRETRSTGNRAARRAAGVGRRFGVEIEFLGNRNEVGRQLELAGLAVRVENYNHSTRRHWKVITDASVMGGGELVSPPLRGADGRRQIEAACRALQAAGATVNRSTGLHVHHEVRDLSVAAFRQLFHNWFDSQSAIDGLVAESRRNNATYCQYLRATDLTTIDSLQSMERTVARRTMAYADRYRTLNMTSYPKYGTVEVRQHQGTINAEKIMAWVSFGQAMIAAAVDGRTIATTDTDALLNALTVESDADRATLIARAAKFAGPAASASTSTRRTSSQAVRSMTDGELALAIEDIENTGDFCRESNTDVCNLPQCRRYAALTNERNYRAANDSARVPF